MMYNSRTFSRLGKSGSIFGMALVDEATRNDSIVALSSDMSVVAGLDRFKTNYPDRFFNLGIAEQNLIGTAAGLSSEGFKPVAVAQAAFITMRSFEQVRQYMGYMKNNIITVGINSGFALTFFGNTHYAIEDVSLMCSIPNMVVMSPADAGEAVKCFQCALSLNSPVYIRLTGGLNDPIVYKEDYDFDLQKYPVLREGNDVLILSTGSVTNKALLAGGLLEENYVSSKIIDIHTLKPFNEDILSSIPHYKLIVTIEEHNVVGGLGSIVANALSLKTNHPKLLKLGVKDTFSTVGTYEYLINEHRLSPALICEDILSNLE